MRWFEVEARFRHAPRVKRIRQKFGKEGLGTLFLLWGEIADLGGRPGVGIDRNGDPINLKDLADATGMTVRKLMAFVDYCVEIGHVDRQRWEQERVIVLPAMVRRGRKLHEGQDETERKAEQRRRRFARIAARDGGARCCRCLAAEQLELERKDPHGGTADENLQIVCIPCGRRRRSERLMEQHGDGAPAAVGPSKDDAPPGTDRALSELHGKPAERPAGRPAEVPQDACTGTGTGGVALSTDSSTHTDIATRGARIAPEPNPLPLVGAVPRARVNPALVAPVMHGALPREHLNCFSAPRCGRVCFPLTLATQLGRQLGGDQDRALETLERFRTEVLAAIPEDQAIGDKPFDFWRAHFAAKFPSAAPKSSAPGAARGPNAAAGRTGVPAGDKYDHITRRATR